MHHDSHARREGVAAHVSSANATSQSEWPASDLRAHPALVVVTPRLSFAEENDTLPGIVAPASPFTESVSLAADRRDVFRITLQEGDILDISVSVPSLYSEDATVAIFGPDVTDLDDLASAIAYSGVTHWWRRIGVPEGRGGDYYLCVTASTEATTTYRVGWFTYRSHTHELGPTETTVTVVRGSPVTLQVQASWELAEPDLRTFTAEGDQPWLTVEPSSGIAGPDRSRFFNLRINADALVPGSYEGTATIRVVGLEPRTCGIHLNVLDGSHLSISASASNVKYGSLVTFSGQLTDLDGVLRPGRRAVLLESFDDRYWTPAASVVSSTGVLSVDVPVHRNAYFRWKFEGGGDEAEAVSPKWLVQSTASVSAPNVASHLRRNHTYVFHGHLKPGHKSGRYLIRVYWQYYSHGTWHAQASLKVRVTNSGSYSKYTFHDHYTQRLAPALAREGSPQ